MKSLKSMLRESQLLVGMTTQTVTRPWLSKLWNGWRVAIVIVKPETVLAWRRQGFRLLWT